MLKPKETGEEREVRGEGAGGKGKVKARRKGQKKERESHDVNINHERSKSTIMMMNRINYIANVKHSPLNLAGYFSLFLYSF